MDPQQNPNAPKTMELELAPDASMDVPADTTPAAAQALIDKYRDQKARTVKLRPIGQADRPEAMDFAQNFRNSATGFLTNVADAVTSPIRTGTEMIKVASGAASKLTGSDARNPLSQYEPYADSVGQFYKGRYGSPAAVGHTLLTDPVGAMADVSTVLTPMAGIAKAGATVVPRLAATARVLDTAAAVTDPLRAVSMAAKPLLRASGIPEALRNAAIEKQVDVLTPKTGANKGRFAAKAIGVVAGVTNEPEFNAWTRQRLRANIEARTGEAKAAMDEALDRAKVTVAPSDTTPILDTIEQARERLRVSSGTGGIGGGKFVPEPSRPAFAVLSKGFTDIQKTGGISAYEDLLKLRRAYDNQAAANLRYWKTSADVNAKSLGDSYGTVADAIRGRLAELDGEASRAMGEWSKWKNLSDIASASNESEAARAGQFPRTVARLGGAAIGGGGLGSVAGAVAADAAEQVGRSGFTTRLKTAQGLQRAANAMETTGVNSGNELARMVLPWRSPGMKAELNRPAIEAENEIRRRALLAELEKGQGTKRDNE